MLASLYQLLVKQSWERTAFSLLADHVLNRALVGDRHSLLGDGTAAIVEALGLVHRALERVALPTKHVVGVGAVAVAFEAPHERVRGAGRPHAVELAGVPRLPVMRGQSMILPERQNLIRDVRTK